MELSPCVEAIKQKYEKLLLELEGVVGVGVGRKEVPEKGLSAPTIVVMVVDEKTKRKLQDSDAIPNSIEGVPIEILVTGVVRALGKD